MVHRHVAAGMLGFAAVILAVILASWVVPMGVRFGDATRLPAGYLGLRNGAVQFTRLSSLPQFPGRDFDGGRRHALYHRITLYSRSATIADGQIHCASGVTKVLTDSRLRLKPPAPVVVQNMSYSSFTSRPLAGLAVVAAFCAYPLGVEAARWCRRRRYGEGRCQRCGYDLTGNVSGRCPECGEAVAVSQRETAADSERRPDAPPGRTAARRAHQPK